MFNKLSSFYKRVRAFGQYNLLAFFPVVGPRIWNDLPADVASAESLSTFRQRLKINLFTKSFPCYSLPF